MCNCISEIEYDKVVKFLYEIYPESGFKINLEKVNVEDISPLSGYAVLKRMHFVNKLYELYCMCGVQIWRPSAFPFQSGYKLILPPVVESRGSNLVVVDGTHRLFYCYKQDISMAYVFIVDGVVGDLPCDPKKWQDVQEVLVTKKLRDIFPEASKFNFRPVGKYLSSLSLMVKNLEEL